MSTFDSKIDAYIEKAQPFAQPILNYLRETVHEFCPDVEETTKWGMPFFTVRGNNLCSMAAFKAHCAFGFWLEREMKTMKELTKDIEKDSMYSLGKIKSIEDLPSKAELKKCIEEAVDLADSGVKIKKATSRSAELQVPEILLSALKGNAAADNCFTNASPSFRKEYIMWVNDAKTEATALKRTEQAVEWIAEGKGKNWKYEKKK